jgi:HD-like signal output (HDOD) protein
MTATLNSTLQQLIQECESGALKLPNLPAVALRVRDAVADPNASADTITRLLAEDAALSQRLIRIANSPIMGSGQPVDTLDNAVNDIGITAIGDLVLSLVMEQMFHARNERIDKKLRQLWEHCTTVSAISHAPGAGAGTAARRGSTASR